MKKYIPIPLTQRRKHIPFLLTPGKNTFHFLHSFLLSLRKKGFCYGDNEKGYQSEQKT